VFLVYYKRHDTVNSTPYNITVKYGQKTEEFTGTISEGDKPIHICSFTLGTARNQQNGVANTPIPDNSRRQELIRERDRLQQELDKVNKELNNFQN
jgi:hypothetical protein